MANTTPSTPDLSESELRDLKVDELRERAKEAGIEGTSSMKKDDLVSVLSERARSGGSGGGGGSTEGGSTEGGSTEGGSTEGGAGEPGDAGPDGGRLRTGDQTSKSLEYSQEVTSPDEDPERPGRSLATTSHEVIRQWAEARGGEPATVPGTEHGDHLGVLRIDFGGDDDGLRKVSWDEWFATFDVRELNFIHQEERKDGNQSTFSRLESPHREDG